MAGKTKDWIGDAVNPAHKGYCTPMTKKTCTPRRKALAERFKHGDLHEDNMKKRKRKEDRPSTFMGMGRR